MPFLTNNHRRLTVARADRLGAVQGYLSKRVNSG